MQVWFLGCDNPLEGGTATHSSVFIWRIPWTNEPGRLQSIASQRVGQDWSSFACTLWIITTYIYTTTERTSWCCYLVTKRYLTLCNPMNCSTPGSPVLHYLPEFPQIHIHWVSDAIQPFHPLLPPSPPVFNLSQHWSLFQWASSLYQVAKASILWCSAFLMVHLSIHTWLLEKP